MKAIIEVTGKLGAGKTSTVITLGEELSPASVLYIDASLDQKLTLALAPNPPELTLGKLIDQSTGAAASREAVDWVFHDLAMPVGDEQELLTVGHLPENLQPTELDRLKYGLTRLIENYDYVILDGQHPVLHALLPAETLQLLDIVTPSDFTGWQRPQEQGFLHTPALILNRYNGEELPPELDQAITNQQIQLIGKLPNYETAEDKIRHFSNAFENCLLRLNIPLSPNPQ